MLRRNPVQKNIRLGFDDFPNLLRGKRRAEAFLNINLSGDYSGPQFI